MYFVFTCRHSECVDWEDDSDESDYESSRSHEYDRFVVWVSSDTQIDYPSLGDGRYDVHFSKPITEEDTLSRVYLVVKYVNTYDTFSSDDGMLDVVYFGIDHALADIALERTQKEMDLVREGAFGDMITEVDLLTFDAPFAFLPQSKK